MTNAEAVARKFHETYERLAPKFNYTTREESATPWEQVPLNNRSLMTAVAEQMLVYMTALDPSPVENIEMESGVSLFDGHPYVTLHWGTERGQLSTSEVKQHALSLLECAEAAETDALLFRALNRDGKEELGQMLIMILREERNKGWEERTPAPNEPSAQERNE
jgi:hypothetical protein